MTPKLWIAKSSFVACALLFLKVASCTEETEKMYSWPYLLENNKVQQFVKFMILSALVTHARDLSRPDRAQTVIQVFT